MPKKLMIIILVVMSICTNGCKNNEAPERNKNCFTDKNFELVCQYIESQLTQTDTAFFFSEDYEIYFDVTKKEISLKKKGYTHSKINSKGIYSLNKSAKGNEKMVEEASLVFCKLFQLSKENRNIGVEVPEELKSYADSATVFLLAEISRDGIEPMANHLYILDKSKSFTRINNKTFPENEQMFSSELDRYQEKIKKSNYHSFISYLDSICTPGLQTKYNTPDYLQVNGGAITYVYIKSKHAKKWLYFEPESGDFIKQLKKKFNTIFE